MQFVYSAITNSETIPLKGKISKWRHLQTMVTQLLLIGLIFFVVLQNGSLKSTINEKLSQQLLEDIFDQRVSQIHKEIQDIKQNIWLAKRKNGLQTEEVKKLIRIIAKEIGLPIPENLEETQDKRLRQTFLKNEKAEQESQQEKQYDSEEQQDEENRFSSSDEENDSFQGDQNEQEANQGHEEDESDDLLYYQEEAELKSEKKCSNYEYFNEVEQEQSEQTLDNHQKSNFSESKEKEVNKIEIKDEVKELTGYLALLGHSILITLVLVCVFMVITLVKNPKYQTKSGQSFEDILKINSKKHKDGLKMSKKELLKLN